MYCSLSNVISMNAGSNVWPFETSPVPSGLALYGSPRLMSSGVKAVERKESVWPSEATACSWEIRIARLGTDGGSWAVGSGGALDPISEASRLE